MRPTLSVCVTAHNAEERLGSLLAETEQYADEVIVGVDLSSSDATWEVAASGADRVYGFTHDGNLAPRFATGMERASCDWVLFLDDDEGMDSAFASRREDLLTCAGVTHWWLPRRWMASLDPPLYLHGEPWWPNWALRLTVNDPTRLWKPLELHSGLRVAGRSGAESRTAVIHYEHLDRNTEQREAKLDRYRRRGQGDAGERFYTAPPEILRRVAVPAPLRTSHAIPRARRRAHLEPTAEDFRHRPRLPPWGARVDVEMPARARPGEVLIVHAHAENTGRLLWAPSEPLVWPDLSLAYRIVDTDGRLLPDAAPRARVGREVAPGEKHAFIATVHVPETPGEYVFRWQLVSEHHHWFDDLGALPAEVTLSVG